MSLDTYAQLEPRIEEEIQKIEAELPPPVKHIDTSQFRPLTLPDLASVLDITIKHDNENKLVTFLCQLSAYTEESQFNVSFNAPTSTGKSYIPLEITQLFPPEDVMKLGSCSPQAFFHEQGAYDKAKNTILVDLSRKIIVFLDQANNELLARLRPLLSHDEKAITAKFTDKNQGGGNRTKTVIILGYPSVIFCTAGLRIDEQESTRFILLSPEINQEKLKLAVTAGIQRAANPAKYRAALDANTARQELMQRVQAIKQAEIKDIIVPHEDAIIKRFTAKHEILKPRDTRDSKRLIALVKVIALLNLWWRNPEGHTITANDQDIEAAFLLWEKISASNELNLPPYIYNLYFEVIVPVWLEKKQNAVTDTSEDDSKTTPVGVTRQEISQKHYAVYGRILDGNQLRQQIIPMLETTGVIAQEDDSKDQRRKLIVPLVMPKTSEDQTDNSVTGGGVDDILNSF